jgi:carboxyl-terminal processing protease
VTARYGGVGLRLTPGARPLRVVGTLRGSPAADAGLGHGDCVLTIDGIPTRRIAFASAVARLQGPPRSSVVLRVLHRGTTRPVVVRLLREELAPRSVMTHDIIRRGHLVRVIRVATFARGVGAAVRRAARGAKAVVLDLRGDPGGLLDEAIATTNVFLHSGRIVSWRGAHVPSQSLDAAGNALPRMPLAVLVDRDTASAAEIVAAALQEHRRAIVIGDRTFGKATLQEVAPLPSGGALKLTIATFLTPLGHDLHHRGVQPDVPGGGDPVSRALVAVRA